MLNFIYIESYLLILENSKSGLLLQKTTDCFLETTDCFLSDSTVKEWI